MSQTLTKQELVLRYVNEVRRILGKKAPSDLARELESLLTESIEAHEAELGRALELQEVANLIADFGTPDQTAGRYHPRPNCLIGPDLYPAFVLVVKVMVGVAAGVPLIVLLVSALASGGGLPSFATGLLNWLGLSYQIALSGLAWAVLVFAILERFGASTEHPKESWDPLSLPPLDDPSRASRIGATVRIYFIVALMILFNFYPQWVGVYILASGTDPRVVTLADLGIELPRLALNLWWLLVLGQNLLLLRQGRWKTYTRCSEFGLGLFAAGIVYHLMGTVGGALGREQFTAIMPSARLASLVTRLAPTVLLVILLILLGASAHRLYRLLRPATPAFDSDRVG
jgi:hypothetical protein